MANEIHCIYLVINYHSISLFISMSALILICIALPSNLKINKKNSKNKNIFNFWVFAYRDGNSVLQAYTLHFGTLGIKKPFNFESKFVSNI